jgi:hypothetical protein
VPLAAALDIGGGLDDAPEDLFANSDCAFCSLSQFRIAGDCATWPAFPRSGQEIEITPQFAMLSYRGEKQCPGLGNDP